MNKKLLLLSAFLAGASWTVLAQDLVLSEGQYYTDENHPVYGPLYGIL